MSLNKERRGQNSQLECFFLRHHTLEYDVWGKSWYLNINCCDFLFTPAIFTCRSVPTSPDVLISLITKLDGWLVFTIVSIHKGRLCFLWSIFRQLQCGWYVSFLPTAQVNHKWTTNSATNLCLAKLALHIINPNKSR